MATRSKKTTRTPRAKKAAPRKKVGARRPAPVKPAKKAAKKPAKKVAEKSAKKVARKPARKR